MLTCVCIRQVINNFSLHQLATIRPEESILLISASQILKAVSNLKQVCSMLMLQMGHSVMPYMIIYRT